MTRLPIKKLQELSEFMYSKYDSMYISDDDVGKIEIIVNIEHLYERDNPKYITVEPMFYEVETEENFITIAIYGKTNSYSDYGTDVCVEIRAANLDDLSIDIQIRSEPQRIDLSGLKQLIRDVESIAEYADKLIDYPEIFSTKVLNDFKEYGFKVIYDFNNLFEREFKDVIENELY